VLAIFNIGQISGVNVAKHSPEQLLVRVEKKLRKTDIGDPGTIYRKIEPYYITRDLSVILQAGLTFENYSRRHTTTIELFCVPHS